MKVRTLILLAALALVAASGLQKKTLTKGDCSVKAENGDSVKARLFRFLCSYSIIISRSNSLVIFFLIILSLLPLILITAGPLSGNARQGRKEIRCQLRSRPAIYLHPWTRHGDQRVGRRRFGHVRRRETKA